MSGVSRILFIDESTADSELAARLLGTEFPGATLVMIGDTVTLADALGGPPVDAVILAPVLGWAASDKVQGLVRARWPRAAVVLFGHERDIIGAGLNPGRACAGIVRKSSSGFLALGAVVRAGLAAPAPAAAPALDALPLPALRLDADGRIASTNAAFAARLDAAPGTLAGRPLSEFCSDVAAWQAFRAGLEATTTLALVAGSGDALGQLAVRRAADGSALGCLVTGTPAAGADGDAAANRAMHDIALVFSHDLRQPMQQITRLARQLADDGAPAGERIDARTLEQLRTCAERAGGMLDSMLEYLAVSTRDAQPGTVDLNACLEEALDNLRASIDENEAQIYAEPLPAIRGDAYQMVHLLQNLVGNALKFRGRARPQVRILCREERGRWRIEVHDNGIGIPAPHRERVFEMGQRLHTRDEYPGTGIGLALCRRITERHGGTIRIESGAEAGSVVVIDLPRTTGQST
ncbi:MAG: ATP-binding protein [Gammaproteobacteria bacterium]